jgi:hypothetical protein
MARRVLALVVGVATALGLMVGAGERPVPPVRGGRRLLRRLPTARSTSPGAPFSGVAPDGTVRDMSDGHTHMFSEHQQMRVCRARHDPARHDPRDRPHERQGGRPDARHLRGRQLRRCRHVTLVDERGLHGPALPTRWLRDAKRSRRRAVRHELAAHPLGARDVQRGLWVRHGHERLRGHPRAHRPRAPAGRHTPSRRSTVALPCNDR